MCLRSITTGIFEETSGKGWKVFERGSDGELETPFERFKVEEGEWHITKGPLLYATKSERYEAGFHIFVNRESAEAVYEFIKSLHDKSPVLKEVTYEDPIVLGEETRGPVIVARRMFVPKESHECA
jgi:hypothetical protein